MLIDIESKSVLLNLKQPEAVSAVIPKSKRLDFQGYNIAVKHGVEETQVLRNLGIKVPSPILYHYTWPGKYTPFEHQKDTAAFATLHRRLFILNEQGTCKTSSALWAADYLMRLGLVRRVLVLSPLSTLERTWRQEIFDTLMHRTAVTLHGSRERRLSMLEKDVDIYVMNHDGVGVIGSEIKKRMDIDLVIVDEASNAFRNASTTRYKNFVKMLRPDQRLWLMTGTPCPSAPTDAWALARLVNPANVPQFFGTFRRQTMMQITQYKWAPRPEAYEIAYKAMQPAIRYKKADCLDLPPLIITDRDCELTAEQEKTYAIMRAQMALDMGTGSMVTAVNAADQVSKLRQIACGVVKTGENTYTPIDYSKRFQVLLECIEEAGAKVIVIVPFKGIVQDLEAKLSKHYSVGVLNGDVSINKRNEILRAFKETPDPHVLLCHPKVMAHGLTLTEADTMVFYAPIYSNDEYQQVKDRINRPGQTRHMTIIRLAANVLERNIYKALDYKGLTQDTILDLYRNELASDLT